MKNTDLLKTGLEKLNIEADERMLEELIVYKDMLLDWNERINLTSITEEREIYIKHFFDSASCLTTGYIKEGMEVIDVGTGAGFPGLVLKILKKELKLTLLDSLRKRTLYLESVVAALSLDNVNIIHGRAEDYANKVGAREKYDIALSRAVASLNVLLEYCLPYVKVGGYFLCQKGPGHESELESAEKALNVLGGKIEKIMEFSLPYSDINHYIIIIKKAFSTPAKYPRKAGKPTSSPIK